MNAWSSPAKFMDRAEVPDYPVAPVIAIGAPRHRVVVPRPAPGEWFDHVQRRLNAILALPEGWDGYRGRQVPFDLARFAFNVLERLYIDGLVVPDLIPGGDGSLQIEWHINGFDIEATIFAPYRMTAWRLDRVTDHEDTVELDSDISILARWVGELVRLRASTPLVDRLAG